MIWPEDPSYDSARRVYNGRIDRRPALIVRPVDVGDVVAVLRFGRDQRLAIAVRGGGHHGAGFGTVDNGLVIDLGQMRGVRVDPVARTARVEAGATLADLDHATHAYGLAVPTGVLGSTGIAGLALGGGIGHLSRKFGLTIDNLLEADVVLAIGRGRDCRPGVASGPVLGDPGRRRQLRDRDVIPVPGAPGLDGRGPAPRCTDLEQAGDVLRWYRDFIATAPEELNGFFAFLTVPPGPPFPEDLHLRKMAGIVWCYSGPMESADEVFAPIKAFGPPALYGVQPMPFPALQGAFDALYPAGFGWHWRADFVSAIPDEAVEEHLRFAHTLPNLFSTVHLYPIDGAVHRVGRNDTPFSYREARWAQVMVGVDPDPINYDRVADWTTRYWEALHPYSAGGAYVNMYMDEGPGRVRSRYRDNFDRLVRAKTMYDPENVFRLNQNIRPA